MFCDFFLKLFLIFSFIVYCVIELSVFFGVFIGFFIGEKVCLSLRHGVRVQPDPVEVVLPAMGDHVVHGNLCYACSYAYSTGYRRRRDGAETHRDDRGVLQRQTGPCHVNILKLFHFLGNIQDVQMMTRSSLSLQPLAPPSPHCQLWQIILMTVGSCMATSAM